MSKIQRYAVWTRSAGGYNEWLVQVKPYVLFELYPSHRVEMTLKQAVAFCRSANTEARKDSYCSVVYGYTPVYD